MAYYILYVGIELVHPGRTCREASDKYGKSTFKQYIIMNRMYISSVIRLIFPHRMPMPSHSDAIPIVAMNAAFGLTRFRLFSWHIQRHDISERSFSDFDLNITLGK